MKLRPLAPDGAPFVVIVLAIGVLGLFFAHLGG